ncbi:MAG: 16S rRNA (cytosine(1402)-N(4))-methyltransferase RsmH [Candidatus Pacebacteria bacterium]|nr:16S rRNA (cytosine(1402)-N(4))-methyltransferase RsmH [Candidatus Paceibacterota bacterium]MBP9715653.1 16S rRNA (cytosine(1402)-N(4))-methyltransferase RsmH [Candidatus Paceibacterota bacterium]
MKHISVLLHETVDGLGIKAGDIIVDGTLGGGGHTREIVHRYGSAVKVIGLDLDSDAMHRAQESLKDMDHDTVFKIAGFQDIDKILDEMNTPSVDRIMLDLGISSFELDIGGRGFSFLRDEPLLMTMKKEPTDEDLTAMDIVNNWDEENIADIIYGFGEEKYSRIIAGSIVAARKIKKIETTFDLVKILEDCIGRRYKSLKIHPATRTFQALRIATNSELINLEKVIEKGFHRLSTGGRIAIISFHSLEDRIVKRAFVKLKEEGVATIITKKPIVPTTEEIRENSRSRSAKLRVIEKL